MVDSIFCSLAKKCSLTYPNEKRLEGLSETVSLGSTSTLKDPFYVRGFEVILSVLEFIIIQELVELNVSICTNISLIQLCLGTTTISEIIPLFVF